LLATLARDMTRASELYKPTNYWSVYRKRLEPAIAKHGISRFRSLHEPLFMSFGVTHVPDVLVPEFAPMAYSHLRGLKRGVFEALRRSGLLRQLVSNHVDSHAYTLRALYNACFYLAAEEGREELMRVSDSCEGMPRDAFEPVGQTGARYTLSFLRYFLDYRWLASRVDFSNIQTILELGSGYGGQAEVILKLHPHIRYVICDIPPQIYVAEQYLKAVFPGQVTGYRETAGCDTVDPAGTGRITVLASWQLERLRTKVDMFWNSASFQEMEPEIVRKYARIVQRTVSEYVFLKEYPGGQTVAARPGQIGVLRKTTIDDYVQAFDDSRSASAAMRSKSRARVPMATR
jgi:putative sugar O-methyltransferase